MDNGIVQIRHTKFYDTVFDRAQGVMVEAQLLPLQLGEGADFTLLEKC